MDEQPDRVSRILAMVSTANLAPAIVPRFWVEERYAYDDAVLFRFEIPQMGSTD